MWDDHLVKGQAIAQMTARYCEVSYETLHATGAEELVRLFEWIGEPVDPHEVEGYLANCTIEKVRPPSVSPRKRKKLDRQFFRRGEVDSWRRELSGSDIAIIERLTRKQMAALGYEPVASRRDRMLAGARLQSYRLANKLAKAVRAGADRLKP